MILVICGIEETKQMIRGGKKRGKPRNRLLTIEKKLMVTRGELGGEMERCGEMWRDVERWVKLVMQIKEHTCHDEYQVMYGKC